MFQFKKPATAANTTQKRQDDFNDESDQDDKWNRTGGSNAVYVPSFGGTGGNSTNTFSSKYRNHKFL